jgi:hypothetical protein
MYVRVYEKAGAKYGFGFGKVYKIDNNKAILLNEYSFIRFCIEIVIGSFTLGKFGMLKTYDIIKVEE